MGGLFVGLEAGDTVVVIAGAVKSQIAHKLDPTPRSFSVAPGATVISMQLAEWIVVTADQIR